MAPAPGTTGTSHPVRFLAVPGIQALDLVGPHEVFHAANEVADHLGVAGRRYRPDIVGPGPSTVTTESPLRLVAEPLPDPDSITGTIVVPGGRGIRTMGPSPTADAGADPQTGTGRERAGQDGTGRDGTGRDGIGRDGSADRTDLIDWLRRAGSNADRIATVCTGAFMAASAGLLDGRRVATHWAWADDLTERHPGLTVDADAIWVRDGPVWSSAGVTAGIDLALAMVEADLGPTVAQTVARWFVVFLRRPGGQSQFAGPVWSGPAETEPVRRAQDAIHHDPTADLRLETLADRVGLSSRHLARRFEAEIGITPARYVETVRLETAQRLLEETTSGVDVIATRSGLGTAESLRRCFQRRLGISPTDYRQRFRPADAPT